MMLMMIKRWLKKIAGFGGGYRRISPDRTILGVEEGYESPFGLACARSREALRHCSRYHRRGREREVIFTQMYYRSKKT